jgi:hypothetical protein
MEKAIFTIEPQPLTVALIEEQRAALAAIEAGDYTAAKAILRARIHPDNPLHDARPFRDDKDADTAARNRDAVRRIIDASPVPLAQSDVLGLGPAGMQLALCIARKDVRNDAKTLASLAASLALFGVASAWHYWEEDDEDLDVVVLAED